MPMNNEAAAERPVTLKNALAYGIGDLYGGGSFFLVGSLAMFYLVAIVGLDPVWAGLVPGLGKIWDAVSDPLMGYLSDRSRSRFGRRRVYFLIGILPVALSFMLVWLPVRSWFPEVFATNDAIFIYYFAAFLIFYTVLTMVMVPYSALAAEMTTDFRARNKLTSTRMFFSLVSSTIAGSLGQPIVNLFDDPSQGFMAMGIAFGIFFAMPWLFVYLGTWELPRLHHEGEISASVFRNFGSIFRNRSFRVHLLMYVSAYAAMDIILGWMLFYLTDCLGRPGLFALLLPVLVITEVLCVPVYTYISNRFGHARAFVIGLSLWGAGMACIALQGPSTPTGYLVMNIVLIGSGLSAGVIIPYNILPFVTDVDELITRKKRAGTYAGAMTLVRKLVQGALVFPLLGVMLTAIGYRTPGPAAIAVGKAAGQMLAAAESMKVESDGRRRQLQARRIEVLSGKIAAVVPEIGDGRFRERVSAENGRISETARLAPLERADAVIAGAREIQGALRITQSPETARRLRFLFILAPLLLIASGIFFGLRFRINGATHRVLMAEIERLKGGGTRDAADPETKRICRELTGITHDRLYRE
jgi:oligogalacturonide transporter